jgi:hypothetical protein
VSVVLNDICIFVFWNSFVMIIVSFLIFVKETYFFFVSSRCVSFSEALNLFS